MSGLFDANSWLFRFFEMKPIVVIPSIIAVGASISVLTWLGTNPVSSMTPLANRFTVEEIVYCGTAYGACNTCKPRANGDMDCGTMLSHSCPGTHLAKVTRQRFEVRRLWGSPREEEIVLSTEPLEECR